MKHCLIHTFNVGGSYGNKQSQVQIVSSAAVLSMKTGRPVKYYQTKTEQMCCFETRLGSQVHAKIGMDKDGVVRAVKAEWVVDTGRPYKVATISQMATPNKTHIIPNIKIC